MKLILTPERKKGSQPSLSFFILHPGETLNQVHEYINMNVPVQKEVP